MREKGDFIDYGRFKGGLSCEGSLILSGDIEDVLTFSEKILISKEKQFITDLNITLTICYLDQCNFEISPADLQRFANLGVPLGITCYESTDGFG